MPETREDEKTVLAMFGERSTVDLNAPQPKPSGGSGPDIWRLVIKDMEGRNDLGTRTYGGPLRLFDGRINLVDLYQEQLDVVCYMRKEIEERAVLARECPESPTGKHVYQYRALFHSQVQTHETCKYCVAHKDPATTGLNLYAAECHAAATQWWKCLTCDGSGIVDGLGCRHCNGTGKATRDVPKLLMLIVSELAEAMEGHRKDLMDDHLPTRKMFEVELADAAIRLFDLAGAHGLDLEGAYREKLAYNAARADHKPENRKAAGGKKY